jgi:hypothetical protein
MKISFSFFSKGLYGRLDKNYVFQTTVTNVEPTAKQSRVLNPYVRRHHAPHAHVSPAAALTSQVPSHGHRP